MFGGGNADELIMDVNDKWWTGEEQQRQKKTTSEAGIMITKWFHFGTDQWESFYF